MNQGGDVGNQASLESQKQGLETIKNLVMVRNIISFLLLFLAYLGNQIPLVININPGSIRLTNNVKQDGKAGVFDTSSYSDINNRLMAIQGSNLPFLAGPSMGDYQAGGGSPGGGVYGPTAQYPLPAIPNLRTKADLINADHIFQAMQTAIYENPNAMAAAGASQPGAQYVQAIRQRQSHSPPGLHLPSARTASYAPNMDGHSPLSHNSGTPALTPPSSAHSYTSGNSPPTLHGNNNFAPAPPAAMYPTLPGASSDAANGYASSSMAPASTLGSQFDDGHRRRYSGGKLQKARPIHHGPNSEDAMDTTEDGPKTPKNAGPSSSSPEPVPAPKPQTRPQKSDFSSSNLDPALGGMASPSSGEMDEVAIKENEMWVGNARTVENIRAWLKKRLESNDYESDDEMEREQPVLKEESESLYPVLAEA